jgi:hypothetical protein
LSSVSTFLKNHKFENRKVVEQELSKLEAYSTFKPLKKIFPRPAIVINMNDHTWSGDIAVFLKYKNSNRHFAYVLVLVSLFDKMTFLEPMKKRLAVDIKQAIKRIFERTGRKPMYLFFDQETGMKGKLMASFLKEQNVKLYHTFSNLKSVFAERKILDLKRKLNKHFAVTNRKNWIDIIYDIETSINSSYNSAIKMRPIDVRPTHYDAIWHNLHKDLIMATPKRPKFKINDVVSVSQSRLVFSKSYERNYGAEKFRVSKIIYTPPVYSYKLVTDSNSEPIQGNYLEEQLVLRLD